MAASATKTRASDSSANSVRLDAAGVAEAVSGVFSDGGERTVAQLRSQLGVGVAGPTESQLSRALRQLVDSGALVRVRRGVYAEVPAATIVPSPRSASAAEKLPEADTNPVTDAPSGASLAVPPASVSPGHESVEPSPVDAKSIARPLSAAPSRPRRSKRSAPAEAPASGASPSVDDAIEPDAAPSPALTGESVVMPTVIDVAPEAVPVEPLDGVDVAVTPNIDSVEIPQPEVEVEVEVEVEDEVEAARSEEGAADSQMTAVIAAPAPAPEGVAFDDNFTALDAERVWIRKAALPIIWFAITGLALMVAGSVIGAVIGVVLGAAALWLYVGLRARDRASDQVGTATSAQATGASTELESIGVK